jgi:hypothetical protein
VEVGGGHERSEQVGEVGEEDGEGAMKAADDGSVEMRCITRRSKFTFFLKIIIIIIICERVVFFLIGKKKLTRRIRRPRRDLCLPEWDAFPL